MKVNLVFDNKVISTRLSKNIRLKDIINVLRNNPKLNLFDSKARFCFMDESMNYLNGDYMVVVKEEEERNYYVTAIESFPRQTAPSIELSEVISVVTNAKTKIKAEKLVGKPANFRLDLLQQMANNIGTMSTTNPILQNRANEFNHFSSLLRNMINDEMLFGNLENVQIGNIPGVIPVNNSQTQSQPIQPNEEHLKNLQDMGFPEDKCKRALIMSKNNINRATDILLNDELDYVPDN
jgi:hypothetical protein